jgi:prophage regulatory protein
MNAATQSSDPLAAAAASRQARRAALRAAAEDPLLIRAEVEAETGLSRSTIYRKVRNGTFPPPNDPDAAWHRWARSRIRAWKARGDDWRSALPDDAQP